MSLLAREDGLVAVSLPTGDSLIDTRWQRTGDVLAGDALSLAAMAGLCGLGLSRVRSRKLRT